MKRNAKQAGELSYFATALQAFLRESHPRISDDKEFIKTRSDSAADTYERAVRDGATVVGAMELAHAVLFQDLRFSRYDTIFEVVSEWFPEVQPRQRTEFCLKMLPLCQETFEMYNLTDDFESKPAYQSLLVELTGIVQLYIEEHGI